MYKFPFCIELEVELLLFRVVLCVHCTTKLSDCYSLATKHSALEKVGGTIA